MFKLIKQLTKWDWFCFLLAIGFVVLTVYCDLTVPDYLQKMIWWITPDAQTGTAPGTWLNVLSEGGWMLLYAVISLVASVICGYLFSLISARLSRNLRRTMYTKVQGLAMEDINHYSTASLITRTTNDITNVQMFIAMGMKQLIIAPITAVWALCKILDKRWEWSAITGGAIVIILITVGLIMALVLPRFKKVQAYIDDLNNVTKEQLTGIRVVRAFNAEQYQEDKFAKKSDILTRTQIFNQRTLGLMNPIMTLVMSSLSLGIYWLGAAIINGAPLNMHVTLLGQMLTFSSYAMQIIYAFLMLVMIFMMWPRASVSAGRINQVLGTSCKIANGTFTDTTDQKGVIEFKHVSFKYPDSENYVVEDLTFKTKMGDTLALIGSTGSGKTTVVNLLMRFYDCSAGEILIDGVNIKDYDLPTLYNKIGYVPQRAVLLSGTVSDNVAFGDNAQSAPTEQQIKQAVKIAQGTEFVEKMPDGYQGHVAQGGTNLSGGQKQRLSIARAVARDPEIYIFDDAFSALDYATDYRLRTELKQHTRQATNVIVAQRIGTIMNADTIVVLEKGRCVGIGKHKELLAKCPTYREIAYSQLSKEELANG